MIFKKMLIGFFVLIFIFSASVNVLSAEKVRVASECDISDLYEPIEASSTVEQIGQTLEIKAKSAILIEPKTGEVLYEMNSDQPSAPASITKIMSLLLVMEAIDENNLSLEDVVVASQHASSMGGSQIWLEEGESMTVHDLLKAAVIASANDATVALGEHIAGSEEGFVVLMNEKAKSLGMSNTHFVNATGLDAEGHISSARDVAIMSAELIKHPLIKNYSTVWMDTLRDGSSELVNTNKLVRFYEGTTGLKTGTTSNAGYCLSATAERDGMELVAVVMDGETSNERFNAAKKLLDYGFANFKFHKIEPEIPKNQTVAVKGGVEAEVNVECKDAFGALLKKTDAVGISQSVFLPKSVKAPIKKGDVVGTVTVFNGDTELSVFEITAGEDVKKMSVSVAFLWVLRGLFTL